MKKIGLVVMVSCSSPSAFAQENSSACYSNNGFSRPFYEPVRNQRIAESPSGRYVAFYSSLSQDPNGNIYDLVYVADTTTGVVKGATSAYNCSAISGRFITTNGDESLTIRYRDDRGSIATQTFDLEELFRMGPPPTNL